MGYTSLVSVLGVGAALLAASASHIDTPAPAYEEEFRPLLSYSPQRHWMNDPNGLVYHDGEYHLFYQYNPNGNTWGDMSWGHAISTDLLHWTELPPALPVEKDAKGNITQMFFSGSVVVDHANASGLGQPGKPAMVALYTAVLPNGRADLPAGTQAQSLAYSLDQGRSWAQHPANPVLTLPPGRYASEYRDFRDPKLFWYEREKKWVMTLVLPNLHKALFYSSRDLLKWEYMSEFGPAGAVGGIWECPDLIELPVDGDRAHSKWVLLMSLNPGGPAGGSGMQYFVGDFDGNTFTSNDQFRWLDYGADFYAGVTFNGPPDGRRLLVGWMNNWLYGQQVPTSAWRSAQSVPRELGLRTLDGKIQLVQQPLAEFERLRGERLFSAALLTPGLQAIAAPAAPVEMVLRLRPANARRSGIRVRSNRAGEYTEVGYDAASRSVYLDRSRAGRADFHPQFAQRHSAPVTLRGGELALRLLVDQGSVTVFAGKGEVVLTDQVFHGPDSIGITVFSEGGRARMADLNIWSMKSIWPSRAIDEGSREVL